MSPWRTVAFAAAALCGFAANSLLCRAALGRGLIDAWTFTGVRLASGALALAILARAAARGTAPESAGSWGSAVALFAYAAAFSLAYVRLGASVGALLLFVAVQGTMVGAGLLAGERPRALEWIGHAVAIAGFVAITAPGATAPDFAGTALMLAAGAAWGIYSLRGRGAARPLAATAGNFARSVPIVAACLAASLLIEGGPAPSDATAEGLALAATSGAVTSGVGYSLWYAAIRGLTATRAALIQLLTPVLTAAAAAAILGESLPSRLLGGGTAIVLGVALAIAGRRR